MPFLLFEAFRTWIVERSFRNDTSLPVHCASLSCAWGRPVIVRGIVTTPKMMLTRLLM